MIPMCSPSGKLLLREVNATFFNFWSNFLPLQNNAKILGVISPIFFKYTLFWNVNEQGK